MVEPHQLFDPGDHGGIGDADRLADDGLVAAKGDLAGRHAVTSSRGASGASCSMMHRWQNELGTWRFTLPVSTSTIAWTSHSELCDGFLREVSAEVCVLLYRRVEKNRRRMRVAAKTIRADRVLLDAWRQPPAPGAAAVEHGFVEFDLAEFRLVRAENGPRRGPAGTCRRRCASAAF